MSTKAILVVSYGTIDEQVRAESLGLLMEEIGAQYPDYTVKLAFTSSFILKRMAAAGSSITGVENTLRALHEQGIKEVYIQSVFVLPGGENDKIAADVQKCNGLFDSVSIALPMLAKTEDYTKMCKIVNEQYGVPEGDCLVVMGHGTAHYSNSAYAAMDYTFKEQGYENIIMGALEAYPDIDIVLKQIKKFAPKKVKLVPFLLAKAKHASGDMAGEEEHSWKSQIEKSGYPVEAIVKGLLEFKSVRDLFLAHLKEIMPE